MLTSLRNPSSRYTVAATLVAVVVAWAMPARAQSAKDAAAARQIVERWQDAVVGVRVVLSTRMEVAGREMNASEETLETVATVVHESGLAVLSLSSLDPGSMINKLMSQSSSMFSETPDFRFTTEPKDVRMRLGDAGEVPATIVLRDQDLDLAFIRPAETPETALPTLDLSAAGEPLLLETLVVLSRLGRAGDWSPAATLSQVQAVLTRPRTMYLTAGVAANGLLGGTGIPAFRLDGTPVGLLVLRSVATDGGGMFSALGGADGLGLLPVVLPAADVLEITAQALEVAGDSAVDTVPEPEADGE